jgi:hypothetical protein
MENEIMFNEEAVAEVTTGSKKGLVGVIIGAAALAGVVVYKKIVKPMIAKRKAQKETETIEAEYEEVEVTESEEN